MELEKAKLSSSTPESAKSDESSTPSSSFTFESDALPIKFSDAWFSFHAEVLREQIDEMWLKYNNCFVCLQDAVSEETLLQEENMKLRAENVYLSVLVTAKEDEIVQASILVKGGDKFASEFGGEKEAKKLSDDSQSSGEKIAIIEKVADTMTRGIIPKAISVRSNEFLTVMNKSNNQSVAGGDSKGIGAAESNRQPKRLSLAAKPFKPAEVEEVQVYKQGMSKTELCNKWEETGSCPYEGRCHFAHGVEELRPVLRHPRYKTQICRMITSGGTCPYGHRCHFRHSLDPNQEKEVVI